MSMRAFIPETDLVEVNSWLIARNLELLKEEDLPKNGIIIEGVAVGFLCCTDSSACMLEGFITNPNASKEDRHSALDRIAKWTINVASVCGFDRAMILSTDETILKRGLDLGFTTTNCKVLVKNLGA